MHASGCQACVCVSAMCVPVCVSAVCMCVCVCVCVCTPLNVKQLLQDHPAVFSSDEKSKFELGMSRGCVLGICGTAIIIYI